MSRGIGVVDALTGALPEEAVVVLGLLTQLGDAWFVALLFAFLYWRADAHREGVAAAAGLTLAAIGCYQAFKYALAFPRPEQLPVDRAALSGTESVLYELTGTAAGYGFPSGHATTSTVAYFGLASLVTLATPRRRFAGAAAIVATVCFTRVGLGVHYLVDVVAGVALGATLLVGFHWLAARSPVDRPTLAFGAAIPFAGAFLVASGGSVDSLLLLAVCALSLAAWVLLGPEHATPAPT